MSIERGFHDYLDQRDFSLHTKRGYLADLEHFASWFERVNGESLHPRRLTPTDIKQYKNDLLSVERRKASTINRRLAAISTYARWAQENGLIQIDPTVYIKSVRQVACAPKWLNKSEQFALHRAIEKDLQLSRLRYPKRWLTRRRDASIVLFLLNTGLRLGELIAMQLGDVQVSDRKGVLRVQNGKGGKQRSIPLNLEARKALQEWLTVRPASDCDFVWVAVEAEKLGISGRAVQRILERYLLEADLDALSVHICRHTFAKNLVENGVGLEKIAALLGHSNLNTTRLYVTPDEHDLEKAVEALG